MSRAEREKEAHGHESYVVFAAVVNGDTHPLDHNPPKVVLAECGDHVTASWENCDDPTRGLLCSFTFDQARKMIRDLRKVLYDVGQGEQ